MENTVLIPTYRRPLDLSCCLLAIQAQTKPPTQVILVVRDTDKETWKFLSEFDPGTLPLEVVTVSAPGVVAALNAGLAVVNGHIVSITDDDAAPHPTWLAKISDRFCHDSSIGAVGGRDWIYQHNQLEDGFRNTVGKVQWFGRVIGNHHLGIGKVREVDVLKGVNMSFRSCAISDLSFDQRMHGTGAQVHFELAFCLALKKLGWKLVYDPQIKVNHYPAKRFDEDKRQQFHQLAFINAVHNETLGLLEYFSPVQRLVFVIWAVLVGTRDALGLVQWLRLLLIEGSLATRKWLASMEGRWWGWCTWKQWDSPYPIPGSTRTPIQ
ncbi:MAG: glycosyltransferase family 2 protein [Richelia sp.]|nr:glycosyltransferase family 2 protein [Richelia sp.]